MARDQELSSMYDYLAKIVLLGPSGSGKSCLLHRFVKNEWRVLSSQTIGVEFATKIVKVGSGPRRKRIKLQLWDTAGTERFRSVSRSYYRGAAGAILVYDVTSPASFRALQPFLNDARALSSRNLSVVLVGNKVDLALDQSVAIRSQAGLDAEDGDRQDVSSTATALMPEDGAESEWAVLDGQSSSADGLAADNKKLKATVAPDGREVSGTEASRWASRVGIAVVTEASALTGDGVDEVFARLARIILTKIELGEIDPDDPLSGIQYGDGYGWNATTSDGASAKSSLNSFPQAQAQQQQQQQPRRRKGTPRATGQTWSAGLREWEEVFTLNARGRNRRSCC